MTLAEMRARLPALRWVVRTAVLGECLNWPCLLSTPIRQMTDTRAPPGRTAGRPPLYDRAPAFVPASGARGEVVMLLAPRRRGASSAVVVGERERIQAMARQGGRRVLEVATIDGHGCLVPAQRTRREERGR